MLTNQPTNWQGQTIGPYRLVRSLARGNTGETWAADDARFNRPVVFRMLPPVQADEQAYLQAFANQARLLAALEHPHILPVYDSGEHTLPGNLVVPYLVLPYIASGSLQDRLLNKANPLLTHENLLYLRQTAQALDYAHSRQIIHGGLKPTNILLQQGQALTADFGLSRLLTDNSYRNRTYTVGIGSAEYLSPEQAQGQVEPASDRYSLAVIAYQLFTGHLPFQGQTPYEIMLKHMRDAPPSPRQMAQIPQEVETVVLQGLAKQPAQRPPSCMAFVDALYRAWNIQLPAPSQPMTQLPTTVQDQEDSEKTQLAPWSRRLRAYGAPPLVPYGPASPAGMPNAQQQNQQAQYVQYANIEQQVPPQQVAQTPAPNLPPSYNQHLQANGAEITNYGAQPQAGPRQPHSYFPPQPGQEQYLSTAAAQYTPGLQPAPMQTGGAAFTNYPNSNMAVAPTIPPSTQPQQKLDRRAVLIGGSAAAVALIGGSAVLFNILRQNTQTTTFPPTPAPGPHKFQSGVPVLSLTGHTDAVWFATWDKSGRYLATAGQDHSVMVWDLGNYLQKKSTGIQAISQPLNSWKFDKEINNNHICWSNDGQKLLVATDDHKLQLLDVFGKANAKTTPVAYYDSSKLDINNPSSIFDLPNYTYVAWSPKINIFAATTPYSFSTDKTINKTVWLWQSQKPTTLFKKFTYTPPPNSQQLDQIAVQELAYSPDGSKLAGLTNNGAIVIWDATSGKQLTILEQPDRPGGLILRSAIDWSPSDPNQILASDIDIVTVFDIRKPKQPLLQLGINDPYPLTPPPTKSTDLFKWIPHTTGITWSPNGRYIAGTYGRSASIYVWENVANGKQERGLTMQKVIFGADDGHRQTIIDVSWSPNGRYIATASYDSTVIIWKVDSE